MIQIKNFSTLAITASLLLLNSCTESYPVQEYNEGYRNKETTKCPISVFVNTPNYLSLYTTKGTGAFDPNSKKISSKDSTFYVYAFRKYNLDDLTIRSTESDPLTCLIDGSEDMGKIARISQNDPKVFNFYNKLSDKKAITLYYNSTHPTTGYNFFAYHIDDCKKDDSTLVAHRNKNKIYYDVILDGERDILCGISDSLTSTIAKKQNKNIGTSDLSSVLKYGYSKFAADRGIYPTITLKHQLTRFKFVVYPGDSTASNIKVKGIKFIQTVNKGHLTVASKDISEVGMTFDKNSRSDISMSISAPVQIAWKKSQADLRWQDRTSFKIGDGIIVAPEDEYEVELTYENTKLKGTYSPQYTIKATDVIGKSKDQVDENGNPIFAAGYEYEIKVVVYGAQQIRPYVTIGKWAAGGTVDVDPYKL